MTFILVLILTISGGQEIQRTTLKTFDSLESCQIYATNHGDLNIVYGTHPPKVQSVKCVPASL